MAISPARIAAFEILTKIATDHGFSSDLLAQYEDGLGERDRGLCHEITLGTLRRQIYLDRVIDKFAKGKKLDLAVRIAMRLGLYQIFYLDRVPAYSAINESVDLVRRSKKSSATGFVNAILRRATRETVSFAHADEIERVEVETSHPRWLLEKWIAEFGRDEAFQIAAANNEAPGAAFRTTRRFKEQHPKTDVSQLFAGFRRSDNVAGCIFADTITFELREFEALGEIYFQDEGSQMVARSVGLRPGERFLDVCASPGSKTTWVAANASELDPRPLIVAGDLGVRRTKFLSENCVKQDVGFVNCLRYDAETALPFSDDSFDVVLLDVPCSGTGTIRRNPEIRYRVSAKDQRNLVAKQALILQNASKVVAPGGRIVYSTCSLEKEENEDVIFGFLRSANGFRVVRPSVPDTFLTSDGFARTFPHRDGMDGFFIAILERNLDENR